MLQIASVLPNKIMPNYRKGNEGVPGNVVKIEIDIVYNFTQQFVPS